MKYTLPLLLAMALTASLSAEPTTTLSGDLRLRGEVWENFGFGPDNDDQYLQSRLRLRGQWSNPEQGLTLFVEGKSALTTDRDLPGGERTLDKDPLALQQAWLQLAVTDAAHLKAGRQELTFGAQRLVSPLAWSNTGRTWDGLRLHADPADWTIDAFYTWFVPVEPTDFNDPDSDRPFYGVYATHAPADTGLLYDLYVLGDEDADLDRVTLGSRVVAKADRLTGEVEAAWQTGDAGDDDIEAWMISSVLSYAPSFCPFGSVWSLGYDISSGDQDPDDGDAETFHPLYPLGHAFHGYIDALGRRNLTAFNLGVAVSPQEDVHLKIAHHFFDRTEDTDAVYHAGNGVLLAADAGTDSEIGQELDITVKYTGLDPVALELGYSHFFAGDLVDQSSPMADDIDFLYLSTLLRF